LIDFNKFFGDRKLKDLATNAGLWNVLLALK
jgi:hypothetical protein